MSVVKLKLYFDLDQPIFGNGVLIDNNHVLTLASNLHNLQTKQTVKILIITIDNIEYYPQSVSIPKNYYDYVDPVQDYGIIKLKKNVLHAKKVITHILKGNPKDKDVTILAHPPESTNQILLMPKVIKRVNDIFYETINVKGISGAPIFLDNFLIGLHYGNHHHREENKAIFSQGLLFTHDMITYIKSFGIILIFPSNV